MANDEKSVHWGVIGHDRAIALLDHAITAGHTAHAFLLTGPHGIGKTTLALALARRLECTGANPPCGLCTPCVKTAKRISPDVRVIEGGPTGWKFKEDGYPPPRKDDRERRTLKVDQIRLDLLPWLATSPFESRYKIAILRRFEEAVEEAANAFLKTLEEPPSNVILILTAQDASLLLPTITSRCQEVALRLVPREAIERSLVEWQKVEAKEARLLARLSGGRLGWAVRAASDPAILENRARALDDLNDLLTEGRAERMLRVARLTPKGDRKRAEELPQLLELWQTWWRDVLLAQNGDREHLTNVDREAAIDAQARRYSLAQVERALDVTRAATRHLEQNVNDQLAMEVLALSLPY